MNKSMLAGIGIGVAAALGVAAVASLNVFDRGPQYAQVISAKPIKETVVRSAVMSRSRIADRFRTKTVLPARCLAQ